MDFHDSFMFHILMIFILSLIVNFHDDMFFTTLVHSTYLMFSHNLDFKLVSWFSFHEYIY